MRFWVWLPVSERRAYREGVRDGRTWRWRIGWPPWETKEPFPGVDCSGPPPAERAICEAANAMLRSLAARWNEEDRKLLEPCKTAREEYVAADRRLGELRAEDARAIREYEAAGSSYRSLQHPLLPWWWHVSVWFFILVGEFSFNQVVFNIFLQPRIDTVVMALGLVVAVVVAAEFVGRTLRRQRKGRGEVLWLVVPLVAFAFFVFLGCSYIRRKYVEYAGAGALGLSLSPVALDAIFLAFNMFLFLVNAVAAYYASPPDPDAFGKAKQRVREARRRMARLEPQLKELSERLARARTKLAQAHVRRTREFGRFQEQARVLIEGAAVAVNAYRQGNMRARSGTQAPNCFTLDPRQYIEFPGALQQLDECDTCIYHALQTHDAAATVAALVSPGAASPGPVATGTARTPVPLVLSEVTNADEALRLFNTFVSTTGLPDGAGASLSRDQLALCLDASAASLRASKSEQDWEAAWERLVSAWEVVDSRVAREYPTGYLYHLFPHLVLPLAFAVGAAVDLRRALVLYHREQERYFAVMDLGQARRLFEPPPENSPAPERLVQEGSTGADKLIVHFFISDRHPFSFANHPEYVVADSVAFLYRQALPSGGDWLSYVQYFVAGYREHVEKGNYREIEICLLGPAVVAFALGMALSREPRIAVCQWFGGDSPPAYAPVFRLAAIERRSKLPFS
jgi:hypothetical protein